MLSLWGRSLIKACTLRINLQWCQMREKCLCQHMLPWHILLPKTGKRLCELNICKKRMSKLEKKEHAFIVGKSHLSWAFLIYEVALEQDTGADPFPHCTHFPCGPCSNATPLPMHRLKHHIFAYKEWLVNTGCHALCKALIRVSLWNTPDTYCSAPKIPLHMGMSHWNPTHYSKQQGEVS